MRTMSASVVLAALAAWPSATAQMPAPAVPTGLVVVHASVDRAPGLPPAPYAREAFQVLSDGEPRPIGFFSAAAWPVAVVLLLDVSASHVQSGTGWLKNGTEQLIASLTAVDRMRIGGFAGRLSLSPAFTADPRQLDDAALAALDPPDAERFGPSPIWDVVDEAVTTLAFGAARRTLIVVTDGRSTGNRHSLAEVAERAAAASVSVNVVMRESERTIPQDRTTAARVRPGVFLERLARYTGGAFLTYAPFEEGRLGHLLRQILTESHETYTLGFRPAALDGRVHRLEVSVSEAGTTVRAPMSYVARHQ